MRVLNVVFCLYRKWAFDVVSEVSNEFRGRISSTICADPQAFDILIEDREKTLDLIFFLGWSWIVPKRIIHNNVCICMHPSFLPDYRGGSPIQHQIIDGKTNSVATFFIMDEKIDRGPIIRRALFSLEGSLSEVIEDMATATGEGVIDIILSYIDKGRIDSFPQGGNEGTFFQRRTPEMSEIKVSDFVIPLIFNI